MSNEKSLLSELTELCEMPLNSQDQEFRHHAIRLTIHACRKEKPLFKNEEKLVAAQVMEKSIPFFEKAYHKLSVAMNFDRREQVKMSLSGLKFLIDEFENNEEIYGKLKSIFDCYGVESIKEYLKDSVHRESSDRFFTVDMNKIPLTHAWWFYEESDESD